MPHEGSSFSFGTVLNIVVSGGGEGADMCKYLTSREVNPN